MQLGEALEVLGLEALPDAGALKRAYLRKLKVHKPERDPDGFRRVRAAFDALQSMSGAPTRQDAQRPLPRRSAASLPAPRTTDEDNEEIERALEQGAGAPATAVDELHQVAPVPAVDTGESDAIEHPRRADPLAEGERLLHEAEWHVWNGTFTEAAERGALALPVFEKSPTSAEVLPMLERLLTLLLRLAAANQRKAWGELFVAFDAFLGRSGLELALARQAALPLAVARELYALPADFPASIWPWLARGAEAPGPIAVATELVALARKNRFAAVRAARTLRARAPILHGIFGRWVEPDHHPVRYWLSLGLAVAVLLPFHVALPWVTPIPVLTLAMLDLAVIIAALYYYDRRRFGTLCTFLASMYFASIVGLNMDDPEERNVLWVCMILCSALLGADHLRRRAAKRRRL